MHQHTKTNSFHVKTYLAINLILILQYQEDSLILIIVIYDMKNRDITKETFSLQTLMIHRPLPNSQMTFA